MKHAFAVLALVAACTELPEESTVSAAGKVVECTNTDCGLNTSLIHGTYFSDLNLHGATNNANMRIVGYIGLGLGQRLDVWKDRLVVVNKSGVKVAEGLALTNKGFQLALDGEVYLVTIKQVHEVLEYWAADDPNSRLETYTFVYVPIDHPSSTPVEVCPATRNSGNTVKSDAVIFEGELYEADTKQIYIPETPGWFNVACRGSAPFKTFFMRHTFASSLPPTTTTQLYQRKALLDAWTANYCGDGHSFTYPGHELRLRDKNDWIAHESGWSWTKEIDDADDEPEQLDSYEAIWNGDGAVCLNEPRKFGSDQVANDELRAAIVAHCAAQVPPRVLKPCSTADTLYPKNWKMSGHILTANPLPDTD